MTGLDQKPQITAGNSTDTNQRETPSEKQTLTDVLNGEEPTPEFLDEFVVLSEAPPVSDEELEQQALNHPGGDGDVSTPE